MNGKQYRRWSSIFIRQKIQKGADHISQEEYLKYLLEQYQNLIYSICLKSVGNPFDAEDLTQEVFLSAYKNLSRFDGTYEKAWLSKIAVRKCLDFLKAAGRRSIPTEDVYFSQIPDTSSTPELSLIHIFRSYTSDQPLIPEDAIPST